MVSLTLSRVVPGIGVTMPARRRPAREQRALADVGLAPASTTRMPSRSSAPLRARSSTPSSSATMRASRPRASARSRKSISSSGNRASPRPACAASTSASRSALTCAENAPASERPPSAPPARCWLRSGRSPPRPGRGRAAVEEGALGELARPASAQTRHRLQAARQQQLQQHRAAMRLQFRAPLRRCRNRRRKWMARPWSSVEPSAARKGPAGRHARHERRAHSAAIRGDRSGRSRRARCPTAPRRRRAVATATMGSWRFGQHGDSERRRRCVECRRTAFPRHYAG